MSVLLCSFIHDFTLVALQPLGTVETRLLLCSSIHGFKLAALQALGKVEMSVLLCSFIHDTKLVALRPSDPRTQSPSLGLT